MNPRLTAAGALLAALIACQPQKPATPPAAEPTAGKAGPVAKYVAGDAPVVVTAEELDKSLRRELADLEQKTYEARRQGLEQLIDKRLIDAKAKAAGLETEAFLKKELLAKVGEPTDGEARAIYERAKAGGQQLGPFDQIKPQIVGYLKQQKLQEVLRQYIEGLRAEAKVELLLPVYLPAKVEVSSAGPAKGPADAPITIVEFSDFECPYCAKAEPAVKDLLELEKYKGKIKFVYMDYPLPMHKSAQKAAEAAHCAGDQGKYWEMHGKLFAISPKLAVTDLKAYARELSLDGARFDKCLDSGEKAQVVEQHFKAGNEAGVNGTPAFYVNGRFLSGAASVANFATLIDAELTPAKK